MSWNHTKTFFHVDYHTNYAAAMATFVRLANNAKRGDDNKRWLKADIKNEWVHKGDNGELVFCYNGMDQVTFYPTNEVLVANAYWPGSSTNFVNAVTGRSVEFGTTSGDRGTVCIRNDTEHRYFKLSPVRRNAVVFTIDSAGAWRVKSGIEPFTVPIFDRKAATAALKRTGAHDFIGWAKALVALDGWSPVDEGKFLSVISAEGRAEIIDLLKDRDHWMDILQSPNLTNFIRKFEAHKALAYVTLAIRRAVYGTTPGVIKVVKRPHIVGGKNFRTYVTALKTYKYALSYDSSVCEEITDEPA